MRFLRESALESEPLVERAAPLWIVVPLLPGVGVMVAVGRARLTNSMSSRSSRPAPTAWSYRARCARRSPR